MSKPSRTTSAQGLLLQWDPRDPQVPQHMLDAINYQQTLRVDTRFAAAAPATTKLLYHAWSLLDQTPDTPWTAEFRGVLEQMPYCMDLDMHKTFYAPPFGPSLLPHVLLPVDAPAAVAHEVPLLLAPPPAQLTAPLHTCLQCIELRDPCPMLR